MDVRGLGHVYQQRIADLDVQFVLECLVNGNSVEGLIRCLVEMRRGICFPEREESVCYTGDVNL